MQENGVREELGLLLLFALNRQIITRAEYAQALELAQRSTDHECSQEVEKVRKRIQDFATKGQPTK